MLFSSIRPHRVQGKLSRVGHFTFTMSLYEVNGATYIRYKGRSFRANDIRALVFTCVIVDDTVVPIKSKKDRHSICVNLVEWGYHPMKAGRHLIGYMGPGIKEFDYHNCTLSIKIDAHTHTFLVDLDVWHMYKAALEYTKTFPDKVATIDTPRRRKRSATV